MKTPVQYDNRPGLNALRYRVGTYSDFRESMLARLSDSSAALNPLNRLRTRSPDDPTIALIDAFAAVGELLTFYQERLANEGYLRTATERRSVEELARLTGYRLRPGVASSVFLALTLDANSAVTLPASARAQSVPGPGQTAQSFETSDDLAASGGWNAMQPRLTRPTQAASGLLTIVVAGASTGLKPNDPVLLVVSGAPVLRRVLNVAPNFDRKQTVINLQQPKTPTPTSASKPTQTPSALAVAAASSQATSAPQKLVSQWAEKYAHAASIPPAKNPPNAQALTRSPGQLFAPDAESSLTFTAGVSPAQRAAVYLALAQTQLAPPAPLEAHAFRASTAPFGNRAPPKVSVDANGHLQPPEEWQISGPTFSPEVLVSVEITPGEPALWSTIQNIFVSTITVDGATLRLPVSREQPTNSGTLNETTDEEVTVTLAPHPSAAQIELQYDFKKQQLTQLTLSVLVQFTDPPSVSHEILYPQNNPRVTFDVSGDFPRRQPWVVSGVGSLQPVLEQKQDNELSNILHLDGTFETITPGTWVAFDAPADSPLPPYAPLNVTSVSTVSRVAYGQTARSSRLILDGTWINPDTADFVQAIRQTAVYADSTPLTLVDEDITDPVVQTPDQPTLELDGLVTGLTAGRWLLVTGERFDLPGVTAAELVMLASANHAGETTSTGTGSTVTAGETPHTTLTFASPLAYSYKRDTVQVFGNVVAATQGESCDEILGSGNGASANQSFTLKKPPVTYVPAITPSGSASTLRIWVNNIEWHEVDALAAAASDARVFETSNAEDGSVTIRFGDGVHGARLPTGAENIRARYRSGLGQSGNLDPSTITSLLSRPLGVNSVTNPIPATGGADAEDPDAARGNVPLGLVSLARLVSVLDYQDFALAFAGIGKAAAKRFAGPDGPLLHLTLAGAQNDALDPSSALWQALDSAVRQFGDPRLEVELAFRAARLAVIQAGVAVDADQEWSDVEPLVRSALLNEFSFTHRALGQTLYLSEVIAAIQGVPGVSYVDLQMLAGVPQPTDVDQLHAAIAAGGIHDLVAHAARVDPECSGRPRKLLPAELVYLSDVLPDMLMLSEVKP